MFSLSRSYSPISGRNRTIILKLNRLSNSIWSFLSLPLSIVHFPAASVRVTAVFVCTLKRFGPFNPASLTSDSSPQSLFRIMCSRRFVTIYSTSFGRMAVVVYTAFGVLIVERDATLTLEEASNLNDLFRSSPALGPCRFIIVMYPTEYTCGGIFIDVLGTFVGKAMFVKGDGPLISSAEHRRRGWNLGTLD
ncbi:hypothetical protein CY34DRAFT_708860 [Suillus luteus UH-Slu-Lm8-n1]|uniref:Uncharacterized protein n=1 Tax=Suillus luteus UH-Slu-Lm8-n1 TaxID=930992 RepID=A0A0D0AH08_9AGAM|nr:hypothetical protein CY34DRAFT_708860 [Suillus luteus UH-Slu-Lm8-n1]